MMNSNRNPPVKAGSGKREAGRSIIMVVSSGLSYNKLDCTTHAPYESTL